MSDRGIFRAAVKLPADRRADYLDEACGANWEVRPQVEWLLQGHDERRDFLEEAAAGATALPVIAAD